MDLQAQARPGADADRQAIAIRRAVAEDAAAMYAVHRASVLALCAPAYSPAHIATWFEDRTSAMYAPAMAAGRIWLAERGGRVLGFVGAVPGEVTLLFVDPAAAGQGLGRRLLAHGMALASAAAEGPLTVVSTLNAVPFYAANGFVAVEDGHFVRGVAGLHYDVVRMQRRSPPA